MDNTKNALEFTRLIQIVKNINGSIKPHSSYRDFISEDFYTFGFFDELLYIKPENEKYLSYKNCLGIEYPNKKENVLSEQLFCIYNGNSYGTTYDVFEYKKGDKPFLGIILVSINKIAEKSFETLTDDTANSFKNILKGKEFLFEIYRTLNCADLCVVIRTASLEDIYSSFVSIKRLLDETGIESNITTFQCISKKVNNLDTQLYKYNENIEFDLRVTSGSQYNIYKHKGVLGIGGNVVRVSFKQYFEEIFPVFIKNKYSGNSKVVDIVHERIFFCNHALIPTKFSQEDLFIDKKLNYIEKLRNELEIIEEEVKNLPIGKYQIEEDILLIHELINTFCDLWYQFTSVNGYIFYIQCCLLFDGIKKSIFNIKKANTSHLKMHFCKMLKINGNKTINCINNYNKILQYLNQDSVNYPTHEMQAKVNTEKYLLAYTAYLHNICCEFYNQYDIDEKEKRRKILPIALFDMNADAISVATLFDKEPEEYKQERMSLYAVIFPTYSRFANIRHVLPLLTHELSHEFRYMKRKDRNNAIVDDLIENLSVKIVQELLRESEIKTLTINGLQTFITQVLFKTLKNVIFQRNYKVINNWHMFEIPTKLQALIEEQLLSFTDRTSERIIYNTNKESLLSLNSNVACQHIEELYNWIYFKKQQLIDESKIELLKRRKVDTDLKSIETLITKMKSATGVIDQKELLREYSILHNLVNKMLEISYDDLYYEFCNYVNDVIGFSYDVLKFNNSKLILTQIQNFYKHKRKNKSIRLNDEKLIKFCEEIIDITLSLNIIGNAFPVHRTSTEQVDMNLEKIFKELHNAVEECCSTNSEYHIFFRSSKYRNIFNTMGLYNEEKDSFVNLLKKVLYRISGQIHNLFRDKIDCYGEICADLGMCAAFGFSPFGYVRFLTNIFEKEKFGMWEKGQSQTSDRINTVVTTLLIHEAVKRFSNNSSVTIAQEFNELKGEFCIKLDEYIEQSFDAVENNSIGFYKKIKENIILMKNYMNSINIFDIQFSDDGIQKHFNSLYNKINNANWVKNCKADNAVKVIGEYYNISTITKKELKQYQAFFEHHINFVFKYYCKHRDLYNGLISEINKEDNVLSLEQCMKLLFCDKEENKTN